MEKSMGTIKNLGNKAWRDYVTDGLPSSGHNKPKKSEIREFANAVDAADQLQQSALEAETIARVSSVSAELVQRVSGDQDLQAQIDEFNDELDAFDGKVARAEAAAISSEASDASARDLLEAATSGFIGFQEGLGYDWGYITDETTYFNQDWGEITS